jgi:hypothetical protein
VQERDDHIVYLATSTHGLFLMEKDGKLSVQYLHAKYAENSRRWGSFSLESLYHADLTSSYMHSPNDLFSLNKVAEPNAFKAQKCCKSTIRAKERCMFLSIVLHINQHDGVLNEVGFVPIAL